jgi:hypothetical protein
MSNISEKFINGLMNYSLTLDDIKNQDFKYCGGDKGRHYNYFRLFFKDKLDKDNSWYIPYSSHCVCGHYIEENCYIINNTGRILILGNCCIKKFVPKSTRTCEICENIHKNRTINRCNNCRYDDKIFYFGKYKGKSYRDIISKDIRYINWLITNDWFNDKKYMQYIINNK